MTSVTIDSPEVSRASLHKSLPWYTYLYTVPFLCLYPVLAYAYYVKYDEWLVSEEWTFLACVTLGSGHALSFLVTRWSTGAKAWVETSKVRSIEQADSIRIVPEVHRGKGEIVPLIKKDAEDISSYTFNYQRDTYSVANCSSETVTFIKLPYPSSGNPALNSFFKPQGPKFGLLSQTVEQLKELYGLNEFNIPIPSFSELFSEHATAPFFVFQIFCVALWCLDEYWYYSLFTLFMLVVFECTVVWQRVRTLTEFRTMSVAPYPIFTYRDTKWQLLSSEGLLPGDIVSVNRQRPSYHKPADAKSKDKKDKETKVVKEVKEGHSHEETTVPADILLLHGQVIVNEAMLSGESTPLVKEGVDLLVDELERGVGLDVDGAHKGRVVFSGTKILQANGSSAVVDGVPTPWLKTPDDGCLGVVLRTGFGTAQGQLVRTMIFSTERVSANNLESFLFIGFLLIFAIAASAYVWIKGIERDLKKSKLLLDCVLIITSVVPPELPMELSLAVNASLVALSKYAIFCTEPFRIPFAGRVDVCCFDKTGTITAENLVLEGVTGVSDKDPMALVNVREVTRETTLCLAAAHALVRLDDGTVVGDPMEKTTLEHMDWGVGKNDYVSSLQATNKISLNIRRRFQFSSALKRMCTVSTFQGPSVIGGIGGSVNRTLIAVKGAPETIRGMLGVVPPQYDDIYKGYTRQGSRVLALAVKEMEFMNGEKINKLPRDVIESALTFAGFLVFHCPLKADAVAALKMLADSSHRCIMITGDNPLTAVHVAKTVEIVDREVLILDLKENPRHERDLTWRTVDERKVIAVDPSAPLDSSLFDKYDICVTGTAMKQFENTPAWNELVQNTWVYARVSPAQKEYILTTLKSAGYITLMAGDGTNDVGALKQAHIGVALLDGTPEDLQKIAERQKIERVRQVYESQLKISARFNQPPPPVPPAIAHLFPDAVQAQQAAATTQLEARKKNPMEKFDLAGITDKLAEMEGEDEVPKIKLGDASCAAPFTSKLSHVSAVTHIIRQGRCTLVATIQMYKILALNCLITAYSLSVQYLDGIKFGDYQVTITGMLMSVCFLCISRAKPVEKLSRERPLGNIFNLYVLLSVLLQFALHIATLVYITALAHYYEPSGDIDLEAKFEPTLLNTAIYLLGLSQQVSTFAINFQGRPFREGIRENSALFYGLVGASAVAFSGATDFLPEINRWLQIVEMESIFKFKLTSSMIIDLAGCWVIEVTCKYLFAELEPKPMITRGKERRETRRAEEARREALAQAEKKEL
ncbi:cation-transporting ATPase [Lentinula aciculospora]|uniref:Cation-transporting ATPase n=1 Tax=Lentinula aciculospora TaxID=153920 RepID=A0A9W9DLD9_9AGAR|nr:cation-transporting ATPase [Lentinula aciculospora]